MDNVDLSQDQDNIQMEQNAHRRLTTWSQLSRADRWIQYHMGESMLQSIEQALASTVENELLKSQFHPLYTQAFGAGNEAKQQRLGRCAILKGVFNTETSEDFDKLDITSDKQTPKLAQWNEMFPVDAVYGAQRLGTANASSGAHRAMLDKYWPSEYLPSQENFKTFHTDLIDFVQNDSRWKRFIELSKSSASEAELDFAKLVLNELGLSLNMDINPDVLDPNHVGIVYRTYKRSGELRKSLRFLLANRGVQGAQLIISVDGRQNLDQIVQAVIEEVATSPSLKPHQRIRCRIMFHPFTQSMKAFPYLVDRVSVRSLLHYLWIGAVLLFRLDYPYILELQDDEELWPDLYWMHRSVYKSVVGDKQARVLGVTGFPDGIAHGCFYRSALGAASNALACHQLTYNTFVKEGYYNSRSHSMTRRQVLEMMQLGQPFISRANHGAFYDGMLFHLMMPERYYLNSCRLRSWILPNQGINGGVTDRGLYAGLSKVEPEQYSAFKFFRVVNEEDPSKATLPIDMMPKHLLLEK